MGKRAKSCRHTIRGSDREYGSSPHAHRRLAATNALSLVADVSVIRHGRLRRYGAAKDLVNALLAEAQQGRSFLTDADADLAADGYFRLVSARLQLCHGGSDSAFEVFIIEADDIPNRISLLLAGAEARLAAGEEREAEGYLRRIDPLLTAEIPVSHHCKFNALMQRLTAC